MNRTAPFPSDPQRHSEEPSYGRFPSAAAIFSHLTIETTMSPWLVPCCYVIANNRNGSQIMWQDRRKYLLKPSCCHSHCYTWALGLNMDRLFGKRKTPEELLKQNQRALNKVSNKINCTRDAIKRSWLERVWCPTCSLTHNVSPFPYLSTCLNTRASIEYKQRSIRKYWLSTLTFSRVCMGVYLGHFTM